MNDMRAFLEAQTEGSSPATIADLCLDHKLIADLHAGKFVKIAGLEPFTQLEILSISMHELRDAVGLAHLHCLRKLDLSHNALENLGDIGDLEALEWLDISHNEMESLEGIAHLGHLVELQAGFNLLQDLAPLDALPALKILVLNGNRHIRDLKRLPVGLTDLHLGKCFIHDYAGLQALSGVQILTLSPGSMNGLGCLTELSNLKQLLVQATRMQGLVQMPPMQALERLRLQHAPQVTSVALGTGFAALTTLEIHHSALESPPILHDCPSLQHLAIKHTPLKTLDGLADLPTLTHLNLEGSTVSRADLEQLRRARPLLTITF
jgi:Leucine-rich repeat (LRR) protein